MINEVDFLLKSKIITQDYDFYTIFPPLYNCTSKIFEKKEHDSFKSSLKNQKFNLYIHIPFCFKNCSYCYYYKDFEQNNFEDYINAILDEFKEYASLNINIENIYIGGGTPSIMPIKLIEKLVTKLLKYCKDNVEVTIEANPMHLNKNYLISLKSTGINRLSVGVQSLHKEILEINNRGYSANILIDNILLVKDNFKNVNVDLMVGLPGETLETFYYTCENIFNIKPPSVTVYRLWKKKKICKFNIIPNIENVSSLINKIPNLNTQLEMIKMFLDSSNLNNYKNIYGAWFLLNDNFLNKYQSQLYSNGQFIGLGPSAYSYLNNMILNNVCSIDLYINMLKKGNSIKCSGYFLNEDERELKLFFDRLKTGAKYSILNIPHGNFKLKEKIDFLINNNVFKMDDQHFFLHQDLSIYVDDIIYFLIPDNYKTVKDKCMMENYKV
jgi:oxygen-independent coproporphyrinogen-3 oxidase